MQQKEGELRLRQNERASENERKKAEEDEEERRLKLGLTNGSSEASGSVAEIESVGSRRNQEKRQCDQSQWLNSLSLDGHYLQKLLSTLQPMSHRTELTNVSAHTRRLSHCSNRAKIFFQHN